MESSFMEENCDKIGWYLLSQNYWLDEDFVRQHKYDIDWRCICFLTYGISLEFILTEWDNIDYYYLSHRSNLPIQFIEQNMNKIDFESIGRYNSSEVVIDRYFDRFSSLDLGMNEHMSRYILNNLYRINISDLAWNERLPQSFFVEHFKSFDFDDLVENESLRDDFYIDCFDLYCENYENIICLMEHVYLVDFYYAKFDTILSMCIVNDEDDDEEKEQSKIKLEQTLYNRANVSIEFMESRLAHFDWSVKIEGNEPLRQHFLNGKVIE